MATKKSILKSRIENLEQENRRLKNAVANLEGMVKSVLKKNRSLKEQLEASKDQASSRPKRINGWTVCKSKDGYHRAFKRINGKLFSVHIGRKLDRKIASLKIWQKEKQLQNK